MDKHYFIKLLEKYQQGHVTKEERQFLESYYNLFQSEPDLLDTLNSEEKEEFEKEINGAIWNKISEVQKGEPKIRYINKRFIKLAAAAAILIGIITSLFIVYNFYLKDLNSASLSVQKFNAKSKNNGNAAFVVHNKENRVIFLPDGSTVILSPRSKLNYPSTFEGMKKREVFLEGEAFFDVKHITSRPFIVHAKKVETTVLGTAFNIKAFPEEKDITVTVKRGKVKVADQYKILGIIIPRQQIIYNTEKLSSVLKFLNNDSYLNWRNQDLFIDNLTLSEAAKILEKQYKIRIIIRDSSIREQRFTATFPKNEKLEQAVKSISEFNGLTYKINVEKSIVVINSK